MRKTPFERAEMDKHLAILGHSAHDEILGIARLASQYAKMSYVAICLAMKEYLREMLAT